MKSGLHDKNLKEATKEADLVFWKGRDKDQISKLIKQSPSSHYAIDSIDYFSKELKKLVKTDDVIIMMSNGNFDGLAELLKSKL